MHVAYYSWGGQHSQNLLPTLVACTVLTDNTRCLLPWTACLGRTPSATKATSCRAAFQEAPARDTLTGPAEPANVFAAASERSAKRPLEDQLRPPSPVDGTEALQVRRPTRLRSEPSNGREPLERLPPSQAAAAPAARPHEAVPGVHGPQQPQQSQQRQQQQQRQHNGARRRLTGKVAHALATNVMITSSCSADEVLRIVDERGLENFNDVNLATAFHRLARVRSNVSV